MAVNVGGHVQNQNARTNAIKEMKAMAVMACYNMPPGVRQAQARNCTEEELAGQASYREELEAIGQVILQYVNFGDPVNGCHIALWTIHRLLDLAKKSAEDMARDLSFDGVTVNRLGIRLGVDKFCRIKFLCTCVLAHDKRHTGEKGFRRHRRSLATVLNMQTRCSVYIACPIAVGHLHA